MLTLISQISNITMFVHKVNGKINAIVDYFKVTYYYQLDASHSLKWHYGETSMSESREGLLNTTPRCRILPIGLVL